MNWSDDLAESRRESSESHSPGGLPLCEDAPSFHWYRILPGLMVEAVGYLTMDKSDIVAVVAIAQHHCGNPSGYFIAVKS